MPLCIPHETTGGPLNANTKGTTWWVSQSFPNSDPFPLFLAQSHRYEIEGAFNLLTTVATLGFVSPNTDPIQHRIDRGDINVDDQRILLPFPPFIAVATATNLKDLQKDFERLQKEFATERKEYNERRTAIEKMPKLGVEETAEQLEERKVGLRRELYSEFSSRLTKMIISLFVIDYEKVYETVVFDDEKNLSDQNSIYSDSFFDELREFNCMPSRKVYEKDKELMKARKKLSKENLTNSLHPINVLAALAKERKNYIEKNALSLLAKAEEENEKLKKQLSRVKGLHEAMRQRIEQANTAIANTHVSAQKQIEDQKKAFEAVLQMAGAGSSAAFATLRGPLLLPPSYSTANILASNIPDAPAAPLLVPEAPPDVPDVPMAPPPPIDLPPGPAPGGFKISKKSTADGKGNNSNGDSNRPAAQVDVMAELVRRLSSRRAAYGTFKPKPKQLAELAAAAAAAAAAEAEGRPPKLSMVAEASRKLSMSMAVYNQSPSGTGPSASEKPDDPDDPDPYDR